MRSATLFSAALVEMAASIVRQRTGLIFCQIRQPGFVAGLTKGLRRSDWADATGYVEALARDARVIDDLLTEITVGETYFFRDPKQFALLREQILPELSTESNQNRQLRLWSAGCATGEEPYSLAMLLRECGLDGRARVLGTDISRRVLARAQRGLFSKWSLRGVADNIVHKYFTTCGQRFELDPSIRASVDFRYLNLADSTSAWASNGIQEMDVVLCRNVLIYFDAVTIARVAQRLIDALRPGGWLLLGAADPPLRDIVQCEVVLTDAGIAYRRATAEPGFAAPAYKPEKHAASRRLAPSPSPAKPPVATQARAKPPTSVPRRADADRDESDRPTIAELYRAGAYQEAARRAAAYVAKDTGDATTWVLLVRALANRGELRAADAASLAALRHHPFCAELVYLHAVIVAEAGRHADAAQALRRALYLDRTLIIGHIALGQTLLRLNDRRGARRAFANAQRLLAALQPDAVVPASDGETAARLCLVLRAQGALSDVQA